MHAVNGRSDVRRRSPLPSPERPLARIWLGLRIGDSKPAFVDRRVGAHNLNSPWARAQYAIVSVPVISEADTNRNQHFYCRKTFAHLMTKAPLVRFLLGLAAIALLPAIYTIADAQGQVGTNVNIITGVDDQFIGDLFRQRQNEPVLGISSVNPSHMMAAYNDYRTVDIED